MPTATLKCRCCTDRGRREDMLRTPSGAVFINADHAASYAQRNHRKNQHSIAKRAKGIEKAFQKRKREFKENDYRHQFKRTLEAAKALCRTLDAGKPCISCDGSGPVQYAAGHFKSAGAHPELALDLRNLHRQCNRNCNCGLSGNISGTKTTRGYRAGLISRYGQELVNYLESYRPPRKYTCQELIAMRKELNAEIRHIGKGNPPSRDWRALPQQQEQAA